MCTLRTRRLPQLQPLPTHAVEAGIVLAAVAFELSTQGPPLDKMARRIYRCADELLTATVSKKKAARVRGRGVSTKPRRG